MPHGPILLSALLILAAAPGDEPAGPRRDPIHSDLPLWTGQAGIWPRAFSSGDSFGCETRMRYGDWRFDEAEAGSDPVWYRFANYGVHHCFMRVRDADERAGLDGRGPDPSFLIALGIARGRDGPLELWALQRGVRPGSDYLLLARVPAPGAITSFDVLQRACPQGSTRGGVPLSILLTGYCAINSRQELIALARRMARQPPLGRLSFVAPEAAERGATP